MFLLFTLIIIKAIIVYLCARHWVQCFILTPYLGLNEIVQMTKQV